MVHTFCMRSMLYAAVSECQLGSESSAPLLGNPVCLSGCRGHLHGTCGHHDVTSENKMHRMCSACFEMAGAGDPSAGGNGKRKPANSGGASKGRKQPRAKMSLTQKGEILDHVDQKTAYCVIASRFNSVER